MQTEYFRLVSILAQSHEEVRRQPSIPETLPNMADSPSEAVAMRSLEDSFRQDIASGQAHFASTGNGNFTKALPKGPLMQTESCDDIHWRVAY